MSYPGNAQWTNMCTAPDFERTLQDHMTFLSKGCGKHKVQDTAYFFPNNSFPFGRILD